MSICIRSIQVGLVLRRARSASLRAFSTTQCVHSSPATDGSTIESVQNITQGFTEVTSPIIEAASNTGLIWVGKKISGFFGNFIGSGKEYVLLDHAIPHLTHGYIPTIYEFIQANTGISWLVLVGAGTLSLRIMLLPVTRRAMRMPLALESMGKLSALTESRDYYMKKGNEQKIMERITEMMNNIQKKDNPLSATLCAMVATPLTMIIINRALRHTSYLSALSTGGVGPFLDMSIIGNSAVGYYLLPISVVGALSATFHVSMCDKKWYTPRIGVVVVPASMLFIYVLSKQSVCLSMHYAISCWFTAFLNISARKSETIRAFLKLPNLEGMSIGTQLLAETKNKEQLTSLTVTSSKRDTNGSDTLSTVNQLVEEEVYDKILEQVVKHDDLEAQVLEKFRGSGERKRPEFNADKAYVPVFKLGKHAENREKGLPKSEMRTVRYCGKMYEVPTGGVKGFVKSNKVTQRFSNLKLKARAKGWIYRQKLMRHGKKGKMSEFLDEVPPAMILTKENVQLTTKVTPGLKRYVRRRQYPMDTLEEMERKVSYIERVQGQRW